MPASRKPSRPVRFSQPVSTELACFHLSHALEADAASNVEAA
jgi:hypothetical protein